ncbi:MAG: hypothetical protein M0R77_04300 [Gammaproteobacteria bacterium]|nr:hypothetical protein [Gammaproteobacteria bacterium]
MPQRHPTKVHEDISAALQQDLAFFESQLAKIPVHSRIPDDQIAREIFERLISECWTALMMVQQ